MRGSSQRTVVLVVFVLFSACHEADAQGDSLETKRSTSVHSTKQVSWLSRYDLGNKDPETVRLSSKLSEISGLAMSAGRLFCHDDESPIIYEIDPRTGNIIKRFTIGSGFMEEDFEGIAAKEDTLFLVNSSGELFEFRETDDRGHTDFRLYRTLLSERNDVEGLEYDPVTDCLLLACKAHPGKGYKGLKAVYAFSLGERVLEKEPRFLISLEEVQKKARNGNFNPSGIAFHPTAGTLFIVSADGGLVIEVDRGGTILDQQELSRKANSQPEGITFTPDNILIISNDGQGDRGTLTIYPPADE